MHDFAYVGCNALCIFLSIDRFRVAPLFSRVTAALTGPQSGPDIKGMFENFIRDVYSARQRK